VTELTAHSPVSALTAVVLDVAPGYRSRDVQEALTDLVLHLLERGYQIFLCVTTDPSMLQVEDFEQPGITYLREPLPPSAVLLAKHPALRAPTTLWITDDAGLQGWIQQAGLPFAFPAQRLVSFALDAAPAGYSDLAALLDPTANTLRDISRFIIERRAAKPKGALLVGIGGPPESGFQRFTVQLKPQLESDGAPLVEFLDLTPFLRSSEDETPPGPSGGERHGIWKDGSSGQWLMDTILKPLMAGGRVYFERRPKEAPKDFDAHFPLFLSEESIVLVMGEMLFAPPVRDALDVSILLEVSPAETTRRLYELPPGETFHPKFLAQYLAGQGGRYRDYLERFQVLRHSTLGIDANRPLALTICPRANA
jgi:hypothetical protein